MIWALRIFGFLKTREGVAALAILAVLTWTQWVKMDATSDCREAQIRVELEEANRKLREAAEVSRRAESRAQTSAEELREVERQRDDLLQNLQSSGESCPMSDDTIERLRAIR